MNKILKHILTGVCGFLMAAVILISYLAGQRERDGLVCKGTDIVILDSASNSFVSEKDILKYLDREFGAYAGKPLDSLDLVRIEKIIDGRSAVKKSHAFVTRDSMLRIHVTQRKPVVRFQRQDGGFYADEEGFIFPLQSSYASHVYVIDGAIPLAANSGYKGSIESEEEREWFGKLMNLVNFIGKSRDWQDKIVQISVAENGELTLVPREGMERFLFGQPTGIEEKFMKMKMYYTHILPDKGPGKYRKVDVRFEGQIVCR